MSAPVVWFEVLGQDADKLRGFYGELFGWQFKVDEKESYGLLQHDGEAGIPGGVGKPPVPTVDGWTTFYVQVEDIEASLEQVKALGGKTVIPVTKLPSAMVFAVVEDPEGNPVGLLQYTNAE